MSTEANQTTKTVPPRPNRHTRAARWWRVAINLGVFVAMLVTWIAAVRVFGLRSYILPLPGDVLKALWAGIAVPIMDKTGFYLPLWVTLSNSALGFLLGSAFGLLLGSLMAEFRPVETAVMPYAFALQSLPKVAIAPLIVIWFGFGDGSKIVIAATLTFFPMLVNSFTGLRATEPERIDLMRTLSGTRLETFDPAGAKAISRGMLGSRVLVNLDSEEDDVLYVGCAGSRDTEISLVLEMESKPAGYGAVKLQMKGLQGGHSGLNIHEGRANAIRKRMAFA